MGTDDLVVTVDVDAPPERTWAAVADWDRQGEWMLLTRVRATGPGGGGVGGRLEAWTGLGPLAVHDTMVIEEWDPPRRCALRHTGRVVRGPAAFDVLPLGPARSRVVWSEHLEIPFGPVGRLAWLALGRPALRAGFRRSLRSLAASLAQRPAAP